MMCGWNLRDQTVIYTTWRQGSFLWSFMAMAPSRFVDIRISCPWLLWSDFWFCSSSTISIPWPIIWETVGRPLGVVMLAMRGQSVLQEWRWVLCSIMAGKGTAELGTEDSLAPLLNFITDSAQCFAVVLCWVCSSILILENFCYCDCDKLLALRLRCLMFTFNEVVTFKPGGPCNNDNSFSGPRLSVNVPWSTCY